MKYHDRAPSHNRDERAYMHIIDRAKRNIIPFIWCPYSEWISGSLVLCPQEFGYANPSVFAIRLISWFEDKAVGRIEKKPEKGKKRLEGKKSFSHRDILVLKGFTKNNQGQWVRLL